MTLEFTEIIQYIGNRDSVCFLIKANNNKYYIFAAKTEDLSFEQNSLTKTINNRLTSTQEKNRRLCIDLIPGSDNSIYHIIEIRDKNFFEDAVKIIQAFI